MLRQRVLIIRIYICQQCVAYLTTALPLCSLRASAPSALLPVKAWLLLWVISICSRKVTEPNENRVKIAPALTGYSNKRAHRVCEELRETVSFSPGGKNKRGSTPGQSFSGSLLMESDCHTVPLSAAMNTQCSRAGMILTCLVIEGFILSSGHVTIR